MKLLSISVLLKMGVVSLLFTVFSWNFAHPSIKKFLSSDTILVKTAGQKELEDYPSVTFCAQENRTFSGWKIKNKQFKSVYQPPLELFCSNTTTVPDVMKCIEENTFSLNETIRTSNWNPSTNVGTDDALWNEDNSELFYQGGALCFYIICIIIVNDNFSLDV